MSTQTQTPSPLNSGQPRPSWFRRYGAATFRSWDFGFGVAAGIAAGLVSACSIEIRREADVLLVGEAALGVALLAVALTALAILVGLLDDTYARILDAAGGVEDAWMPYQTVSAVGALATISSSAALFLRPWTNWPIDAAMIGVATFFSAWATGGTVQLVNMTAFHGRMRNRIIQLRLRRADAQPPLKVLDPESRKQSSGS